MSNNQGLIGVEVIGIDKIYRLVDDLQEVDRNRAIKKGLLRGAQVFVRIGRNNLTQRNHRKTGNLQKSFRVRVKKDKLGALAGFNMIHSRKESEGYGSHSWLVDMGTVRRYTTGKASVPAGQDRGIMPASYFWSDAKEQGGAEAIRAIEGGIHEAVEQWKRRNS